MSFIGTREDSALQKKVPTLSHKHPVILCNTSIFTVQSSNRQIRRRHPVMTRGSGVPHYHVPAITQSRCKQVCQVLGPPIAHDGKNHREPSHGEGKSRCSGPQASVSR